MRPKFRQALQWWYQRSSQRSNQQSEILSHNALQTVFALRRQIEAYLANNDSPSPETLREWVKHLENLYEVIHGSSAALSGDNNKTTLEILSNFIREWNQKYREPKVKIIFQGDTSKDIQPLSSIIVDTTQEIINLSSKLHEPISILLSLTTRKNFARLDINIIFPEATFSGKKQSYAEAQEERQLKQLQIVFPLLTGGKCQRQETGETARWQLSWNF